MPIGLWNRPNSDANAPRRDAWKAESNAIQFSNSKTKRSEDCTNDIQYVCGQPFVADRLAALNLCMIDTLRKIVLDIKNFLLLLQSNGIFIADNLDTNLFSQAPTGLCVHHL
ncbi:MAG: hypothetical protein KF899_03245 [Parvibaculum sp.]|nr:hypothetical protein [Parvibaculum sp.]